MNYFDKLMSENISKIIVMGHSYSEIDYPYFEKIAQVVKADWILSYYSDSDKRAAECLQKRLKSNSVEIVCLNTMLKRENFV